VEEFPESVRDDVDHNTVVLEDAVHLRKGCFGVGQVLQKIGRVYEVKPTGLKREVFGIADLVSYLGMGLLNQTVCVKLGAHNLPGAAGQNPALRAVAGAQLQDLIEGVVRDAAEHRLHLALTQGGPEACSV
jgi:hypothetical protein